MSSSLQSTMGSSTNGSEGQNLIAQAGDIVLTNFGIAVCVRSSQTAQPSLFKARLWRVPGKSVGSAAVAFLRHDTIIKKLPAAPGMTTMCDFKTNEQKVSVLVQNYSPSTDTYLVTPLDGKSPLLGSYAKRRKNSIVTLGESSSFDSSLNPSWSSDSIASDTKSSVVLIRVPSSLLTPAKSAKFYPLLDDLMQKGNEAAQLASTTINQNPEIGNVLTKSLDLITAPSEEFYNHDMIHDATALLPSASEAQELYRMLRDEELTVLLEKGQQRLKQLVEKDLPQAKEYALQNLGIEILPSEATVSDKTTAQSHSKALTELTQLLSTHPLDFKLEDIGRTLSDQLESTLKSLSVAAGSDETLNSLFETINQKTLEWQKLSGRILETRSVSIFLEGSQWLQKRVEGFFPKDSLDWSNAGNTLMKAFTEGDVALAQLKSIELGESIRSRLISAIEVRSDSQGGLDGIIAGAISSVHDGQPGFSKDVQSVIAELQNTATSARRNARESLLSVLSQRSQYQDAAVLRIEQVLLDLDSYIGEELTPEQLALFADGGASTAALFDPIANKAAKEIELQLDAVEAATSDPAILSIIRHVRKIVTGGLSTDGLIQEVANILNDDHVVDAGEQLMVESERLLDVIEGVTKNDNVDKMIAAAEKAGLTKENIRQKVESLNMASLLQNAEDIVTDESKRLDMISSLMDSALDFFLRILPSMPIPPFEGAKDGLLYNISNLSMQGFRVKKEDIVLEIAGIKAEDQVTRTAAQNRSSSDKSQRILVIDIQNISAVFEKAQWCFEQTYLPYMKRAGAATARMSRGSIRLVFELRKRRKLSTSDMLQWEPILCLHDRECSIDEVDLVFEGDGGLTWVINKITSLFKTSLRDYVVRSVLDILAEKSGWLLENLNKIMRNYWEIVLKVAGLSLDGLLEASDAQITAASPDSSDGEIDLVWRDHLPLGINLMILDKKSVVAGIRVVEFPRGSQARKIAIQKDLDPDIFRDAMVVGVNGTRYSADESEAMFFALKDPTRPKTIKFLLSKKSAGPLLNEVPSITHSNENETLPVHTVTITAEGPLALSFSRSIDNRFLVIKNIGDTVKNHEFTYVHPGDLLTYINGKFVGFVGGISSALETLESEGAARPLKLTFMKPFVENLFFCKPPADVGMSDLGGPNEFILETRKSPSGRKRVVIKGFRPIDGIVEGNSILLGDRLIFVNATPVGKGCALIGGGRTMKIQSLNKWLQTLCYPISLVFARTQRGSHMSTADFDVSTADQFNVLVKSYEQMGCEIGEGDSSDDFVVKKFNAVEGLFQQQSKGNLNSMLGRGSISIESINGQQVPIYATADIIQNTMQRLWRSDGKLDLIICDEEMKNILDSMMTAAVQ